MGGGGLISGNHRTLGLTSLVQLVPRSRNAESPGGFYFYSIQSHWSTAHRWGVSGRPMAAMGQPLTPHLWAVLQWDWIE